MTIVGTVRAVAGKRGPRMYQLVRAPGPVRERTVDVTFDGPVRAYVYTFG